MDIFAAERFAWDWIRAWNDGDLDRILAQCSEQVRVSDAWMALTIGEADCPVGKEAVRRYWKQLLEHQKQVARTYINAYAGVGTLVSAYSGVDGLTCAEFVRFDAHGKVCEVHAHYAPTP
jgi:hypothetical protein